MSSSPSSSSSASSSYTSTTVRRLAGILRRMLCSRSLPTHPTDHITESVSSIAAACDDKAAPSVVAKLMGLDSMPSVIIATPTSITRSRSMNSIDYCKGICNDHDRLQAERRRVKGTLSFRDMPMPTFFELEDEDFFVLSFEKGSDHKKEKRLKEKIREKGFGELKQSSDFLEFSTPNIRKQVSCHGAKSRKKKKKMKLTNVELECSSEESSPVSVLDFDQFIIDHEVTTSADSVMDSNSRRKLSPEPERNECQSQQRNDDNLMILDDPKRKKAEGKCVGSRKKDCRNQDYINTCDQICKMVEAEILDSNWPARGNFLRHQDFEDIFADFESQILERLLHELVL